MNIKEFPVDELIEKLKEKMKSMEEFKPPEWSSYVKTGVHNERPPEQVDWWHIRAAAVLRKVGVEGTIGTENLRKLYGGRKNKGHKPEHKKKASGSIIRKILQQLEAAELVATKKGKGRSLTQKGKSFIMDAGKATRAK